MEAEDREGLLSANRIAELEENPVKGRFDAAHLKEIHRRIFQDMPEHTPGEFRPASPVHMKARSLEGSAHRYYVHYAARDEVDSGIDQTLAKFGGPASLRGLNAEQFSAKVAQLYGDLDYLHPFKEGNSRTLRVFTSQLAREAGFELDWNTVGANAEGRDKLYIARDKDVIKRAFPGLDEARAMGTDKREEYEAYTLVVAPFSKTESLQELVKAATFKQRDLDAAQAFRDKVTKETFEKHPDLAGSYAKLMTVVLQAEVDGLNAKEREIVAAHTVETLAKSIERGERPGQQILDTSGLERPDRGYER